MDTDWQKAWIGIGGNLGDVPANMQTAIERFNAVTGITVGKSSHVYKTPPWGKTDQPWFFNAAFEIETNLSPDPLLDACLETERNLHRVRSERWGPRTIDLDVLLLEEGPFQSARLTVPHPRMSERAFVMKPLMDIAPDLEIEGKSVRDWVLELDISEIEQTEFELKV